MEFCDEKLSHAREKKKLPNFFKISQCQYNLHNGFMNPLFESREYLRGSLYFTWREANQTAEIKVVGLAMAAELFAHSRKPKREPTDGGGTEAGQLQF